METISFTNTIIIVVFRFFFMFGTIVICFHEIKWNKIDKVIVFMVGWKYLAEKKNHLYNLRFLCHISHLDIRFLSSSLLKPGFYILKCPFFRIFFIKQQQRHNDKIILFSSTAFYKRNRTLPLSTERQNFLFYIYFVTSHSCFLVLLKMMRVYSVWLLMYAK